MTFEAVPDTGQLELTAYAPAAGPGNEPGPVLPPVARPAKPLAAAGGPAKGHVRVSCDRCRRKPFPACEFCGGTGQHDVPMVRPPLLPMTPCCGEPWKPHLDPKRWSCSKCGKEKPRVEVLGW